MALLEGRFSQTTSPEVMVTTYPLAADSEEEQENKQQPQQQQSHPQSNSASKSQHAFPLTTGVPERIVMEEEESKMTSSSRSQLYTITNDTENRGEMEVEQHKPTNPLKTLKRKMSIPPQIASTEGSPKLPKNDEQEREMVITESGSRGAAGGAKRSILSYFPVQGDKHTLSSGVFPNGHPSGNPPSSSSSSVAAAPFSGHGTTATGAGAGDIIVSPPSGKEGATASKTHRSHASSSSSSHHHPSSKTTSTCPSSSSSSSSSSAATAVIEAKKQLEGID